jgi:hypothetical protein
MPVVKLLLQCLEAESCTVQFEAEGATTELKRSDALTVEFRGHGDGVVEVCYHPWGMSLWAWSGADATAWNKAGERLSI